MPRHLISGAHEWINEIPTAINANANLKAIHMLRKLHEKSIIRIGGDPYQERSAVVDDTPGQGTNYAPTGISLTLGICNESTIPPGNNERVGDVTVGPQAFVDDSAIINAGVCEARENGELMSKAFKTISLCANADKSVCGGGAKEDAERTKEQLTQDPVKLHGEGIKCAKVESYLGFSIHEEGVKASINQSVKTRVNRAWSKVAGIKSIMNNTMIKQFGWLRCGTVLCQTVFPPVLSYSAECWLLAPQYVIKNIEVAFKQIVYCLFEISLRTKYSFVLLELGLTKMEHFIARNQIGYMLQVVWDMRGTMVHDVVIEEFKSLGALAAADKLAEKYGFRKTSEITVDKKVPIGELSRK